MLSRTRSVLPLALLLACSSGASQGGAPATSRGAFALSVAQTPAAFARLQPAASTLRSSDGARLLHASGFSVDTGLADHVDAAAAFLASQGAAFGVIDRHELALVGSAPVGPVGAVHVGRFIDGLRIFGGDVVVGVRDGAVFAVNAADVPAAVTGSHAIGPDAAAAAARAAVHGAESDVDPATVVAGWRPILDQVRAVYRVDVVTRKPAGEWRLYVDGETGGVLFRQDLRTYASANGSVYEISPAETLTALCPLSSGAAAYTSCASPIPVTLQNLTSADSLVGSQTSVWNCRGASAPTGSPVTNPGGCAPVSPVGGGFSFTPAGASTTTADDFAAVMAYYHLDKHVSYFRSLDPSLPGGASRALNGSLPGFVNVLDDGAPIDNAYFSPVANAMIFGQGTHADLAYDATVMYHEFTHGVVDAWGGFEPEIDAYGALDEPGGVNEGTADAMAVAETGHSVIGGFLGPALGAGPGLRDMSDPTALRSCQGSGAPVSQFGVTAVNGLVGEVHADGEIWNGFFWEIFQGLKQGGWKACDGGCEAGPALQYKALQLAAGTSPTFASYAQTMKAAATALFPGNPEVADYVQCVATRRGFDACDRTVNVYQGETKVEFVRLRYSPFQVAVTADSSARAYLDICSARGLPLTVYYRKGQPVQITSFNPSTLEVTVTADGHVGVQKACSAGAYRLAFGARGAGTSYFLIDASNAAFVSQDPGYELLKLDVSSTGVSTRPTRARPACLPPIAGGGSSLALSPQNPTVSAGSAVRFSAAGGTAPYAYSLQTNASGGTIDASTGTYTACNTAGSDVVLVTDAASAIAMTSVTVTASGGGGGGGGGCATGEGSAGALSVLLVAILAARLRRRRGDASARCAR